MDQQNNRLSIKVNDRVITSPSIVAGSLNQHFQQSPLITSSSVPSTSISNNHIRQISHTVYLHAYTEFEMLSVFDRIKNKFTSGPDGVPACIIREFRDELVTPITYLINSSFDKGIFPDLFKTTSIKPVHKKGDHNITNFRPIALCSSFSKLFEYALLNRMEDFINKFNLLSSSQHGFRTGKSTISALLDIHNSILRGIENKLCPIGVLCDMKKAFDCVQHRLLLDKLDSLGFRGNISSWIASYLSDRIQFVEVGVVNLGMKYKIRSSPLPSNIGVPQGSVLGPILFSLFIDDVVNFLSDFSVVCYADDITVLSTSSRDGVEHVANDMLDQIYKWCCANGLSLSLEKTKYILFHTVQMKINSFPKVQLSNCVISQSRTSKLLGVTLSSSLRWEDHCRSLISKLNSVIFKIRQLKESVNTNTLKIVYYSEFQSQLIYGILLWGSSCWANEVFLRQKAAIRCITNVNQLTSCRGCFAALKILTLYELYILESSCYIHKQKDEMFRSNNSQHNYSIRDSKIHVKKHSLKLSADSVDILGVKIYNRLPDSWKAYSLNRFKKTLKFWLLTKCFYSFDEFFNCSFEV